MDKMTHSYSYYVKPWILFSISAGALFPAVFLLLFGMFARSPLPLTLIYVCLSLLSFLGVFFTFLAGLRIGRTRPKITLSDDGVTAPFRAWSNRTISITYSQIESLEIVDTQGERILRLNYDGHSLDLQERFMEGPSALKELWSAIDYLRNEDGTSTLPHQRRVPCSLCNSPVKLSDAQNWEGKCHQCFSLKPTDFRWAGLRLIGLGTAFIALSSIASAVAWGVGGVIIAFYGMMVFGSVMIALGLYGTITGRPIRHWHF